MDEFQTDKSKKDASTEISEEKRKEKEQLRLIQENKEKERLDQQTKNLQVFKANKVEIEQPKTIGKIDLQNKNSFVQKEFSKKEEKNDRNSIAEPKPKNDSNSDEVSQQKVNNILEKDIKPNISHASNDKIDLKNESVSEDETLDQKIETQYKKLSGPKKTGQTINLEKVNEKEQNVEDARKKKRKKKNLQRKR